ncbi:MAG: tetratricopeptide repeat protein [Planctomycetes bacterium]|nr:tetratricopeptide repeat protein [Planctomycetota bacterium]
MGFAHKDLGHPGKAVEALRKAVEFELTIPALNNMLGDVLMEFGRQREAARAFRATLDQDPNEPFAISRLAQMEAGSTL